jgi:hypothetical protein
MIVFFSFFFFLDGKYYKLVFAWEGIAKTNANLNDH